MKLIKDIRLFESAEPNVDGNSTPYYIGKLYHYDHMECLDVIQRLLFLLRHRGFCYEGFDHLYLNLTPCLPHGELHDVNRYTIREFSWFHYVDMGCDVERFNRWTLQEQTDFILDAVKQASLMKSPPEMGQLFSDTFGEVLQKGANLLLPYKRKENENYIVDISLRISDELDFLPCIRVTGKTWILKEFGRRYYENTAYFNFDKNEEYKQFFETTKDVLGFWGSPQQAFAKNREGTSQDRVCIYRCIACHFLKPVFERWQAISTLYIQIPCLPLLSLTILTMKIKKGNVYRNLLSRTFFVRYLQ